MQLRQTLSNAWTAFNDWRVKGWPVRVVILLLIFAPILYERLSGDYLIVRLVGIAVEAIFNDCEPKLAAAKTRYYNVRDMQRLRSSIRSHFDVGTQEGEYGYDPIFLRLEGISPSELSKPSIYANASYAEVERLAKFAKRYAIVRHSYSVKEMRREAFYAGLAEVEAEDKAVKDEIARMLANPIPKTDYLSSATWLFGVEMFCDGIFFSILECCSPFPLTVAWLLICFFMAAFIANATKGSFAGRMLAVAMPVVMTAVLAGWNYLQLMRNIFKPGIGIQYDSLCLFLGLVLFVVAVVLKGMKSGIALSCRALVIAFLFFSAIWMAIGFLGDLREFYSWNSGMGYLLFLRIPKEDIAFSPWITLPMVALSVLGCWFLLRGKHK